MNNRGLTLLEVLVIFVVIAILAALLLPVHVCSPRRDLRCLNNMQQLYTLGTVYATMHRGEWPAATGQDLWLCLRTTKPPLIEDDHAAILHCDVLDHELTVNETNYRGPRLTWAKLGPGDLLSADREGNHGKGESINVMHTDGSVMDASPGDELWKKCRDSLAP